MIKKKLRQVNIPFKLQETPLQIWTTGQGWRPRISIGFTEEDKGKDGWKSGAIKLILSESPELRVRDCDEGGSDRVFNSPYVVPESHYMVWTIFRTPTGLKLDCNGLPMFNVDVTDCDEVSGDNKLRWKNEVNFIRFTAEDTASQKYRPASFGK